VSETDSHHFDFDLDRGIRTQVVEKLEASPLLALTKRTGPNASGIYALYFKGQLVYIGKASKGTTKAKERCATAYLNMQERSRGAKILHWTT
jgi:hypothetical protein